MYAKTYKFERTGPGGKKINRVAGVCWFASLDHGKRHQPLELMTLEQNQKFNKAIIKSIKLAKPLKNCKMIKNAPKD